MVSKVKYIWIPLTYIRILNFIRSGSVHPDREGPFLLGGCAISIRHERFSAASSAWLSTASGGTGTCGCEECEVVERNPPVSWRSPWRLAAGHGLQGPYGLLKLSYFSIFLRFDPLIICERMVTMKVVTVYITAYVYIIILEAQEKEKVLWSLFFD